MNDGKIVTHVAATFGFDEILKLLLEKSEANERAAGERAKVQDTMNVDEEAVWEEIEIIEKSRWIRKKVKKSNRGRKILTKSYSMLLMSIFLTGTST